MAEPCCGAYERCFRCQNNSETESARFSIAAVRGAKKRDSSTKECVVGVEEQS